jgi:alkylhydroperoxidase family enzyme
MEAQGSLINLYRAMAHSPEAMTRLVALLSCLWDGSVTERLREVAILATVSASGAGYPLAWHIGDAQNAGLTPEEIRDLIGGAENQLSAPDAAVARFARELTVNAAISDLTFDAVAAFMDEGQIVELTMLVSLYRFVSCFANALDVDLDHAAADTLSRFEGTGI